MHDRKAIELTYHAWLHGADRLVLRVVRDVGVAVEEVVHSMPDEGVHDGASVGVRDGLARK